MESTKDQALMDLQSAARVQQLKLDTLERSLELTQRELKLARAEIDHDLTSRLSPIKVAGLIIVLLGATSVFSVLDTLKETEKTLMKDMEQSLKTQIHVQISKRLQYIDPTSVAVHVRRDSFERELQRLRRFGFRNIHRYTNLEEISLEGVVIVRLRRDPSTKLPETEEIEQFVRTHKPHPDRVGFLFYDTGTGQFPRHLLQIHPAADYSTSITTLLSLAKYYDTFWFLGASIYVWATQKV